MQVNDSPEFVKNHPKGLYCIAIAAFCDIENVAEIAVPDPEPLLLKVMSVAAAKQSKMIEMTLIWRLGDPETKAASVEEAVTLAKAYPARLIKKQARAS